MRTVNDVELPKLRDAETLWRSVAGAAMADTIFASHARSFKEANAGLPTNVDFAKWVQVAATQDLGQALPQPSNIAAYAAWLVANVGSVMNAHQEGRIGGFKPSVQPTIINAQIQE